MKKDFISNFQTGKDGEAQAVEYLENIGYSIIKQNFHFGQTGEIDIIAKDGDTLVFVEVKARNSDKYGSPLQSITPAKQKKIVNVAKGYLMINNIINTEIRFDVIAIDKSTEPHTIEHLQNAIIIF
ncbi:MAG: YraN family protein [Candidatus Kapaibacteriota bacterium]